MQLQVKPWGNSQGIRLSKEVLEMTGFHVNDLLDIQIEENRLIISKPFVHKTLRERAAAYGGRLNLSEEIDWGEPVGREVW